MPGAAIDQPIALAMDILELRAYARAKAQSDAAKTEDDEPDGPIVDWLWKVQTFLHQQKKRVQREREAKQQEEDARR